MDKTRTCIKNFFFFGGWGGGGVGEVFFVEDGDDKDNDNRSNAKFTKQLFKHIMHVIRIK